MNIQKGDLIQLARDGHFDVIVHGCNCHCAMGAGIAKQIKKYFPEAWQADQQTKAGDKAKLGTYSFAEIKNTANRLTVINAYTQYDFSGTGVLVDYSALRKVFSQIKNEFGGRRIAYPKIGAGLAKGDWEIISGLIDQELESEDHTLVEYSAG